MTYPVTVYRWDDPGAPQLATTGVTPAAMIEILTKCLVTGYGSKSPLGWTKTFDDTQGVVYQNNVAGGGSGMMVRFWPGSSNWTAILGNNYAAALLMQSAKTYSASNSPFLPSSICMMGSVGTGTQVKGWILVGTAIGFYFISSIYSPTDTSNQYSMRSALQGAHFSMYVGDILSAIPNDAYPFVCITNNWNVDTGAVVGQATTAGLDSITDSMASGGTNGTKIYEGDGGTAFARYGLRRPFTDCAILNFAATNQNDLVTAGPVVLTKGQPLDIDNTVTNKLPHYRGRLPGLINTLMGDGGTVTKWPMAPRSIGGVNHLALKQVNYLSNVWVNMVDW